MKPARLLIYGAAGIIAGLLLENRALIAKQCIEAKGRMLKKKAKKLAHISE